MPHFLHVTFNTHISPALVNGAQSFLTNYKEAVLLSLFHSLGISFFLCLCCMIPTCCVVLLSFGLNE